MGKRGGYFPHAERWGRKSTWQNLPTALIRVPEGLTEPILNYAHAIDNGRDYEREIILTAIDKYINSQLTLSGGNQHRKKGEALDIKRSRDWSKLRQFREWVKMDNK